MKTTAKFGSREYREDYFKILVKNTINMKINNLEMVRWSGINNNKSYMFWATINVNEGVSVYLNYTYPDRVLPKVLERSKFNLHTVTTPGIRFINAVLGHGKWFAEQDELIIWDLDVPWIKIVDDFYFSKWEEFKYDIPDGKLRNSKRIEAPTII